MTKNTHDGSTAWEGRTVFVTGAGKGLGEAVARRAHAQGANVVLTDVDASSVEGLAKELGARALAHRVDVTSVSDLDAAVAAARAGFGGLDIVVANAGIAPPSRTIRTIDPDAFERTVEIDLMGQWRTIRATLPSIVERRGHVLAISSIYAFFNGTLNASYAASKAGLEQIVRALRVELAPHGATAGVAYLGFVQTDLVGDVFAQRQVDLFRRALPAFLTEPVSVDRAADALVTGLERRSPRVTCPAWVGPALRLRGLTDPLADRLLMVRARAAVVDAERGTD